MDPWARRGIRTSGRQHALQKGDRIRAGRGQGEERIATLNATLFDRNDPQVLAAAARSLPQVCRLSGDSLRDIKLPALAIIGERDENRTAVSRMKALLPGLEVIEMEGASHGSSIKVSADPIVGFLKRYRQRR